MLLIAFQGTTTPFRAAAAGVIRAYVEIALAFLISHDVTFLSVLIQPVFTISYTDQKSRPLDLPVIPSLRHLEEGVYVFVFGLEGNVAAGAEDKAAVSSKLLEQFPAIILYLIRGAECEEGCPYISDNASVAAQYLVGFEDICGAVQFDGDLARGQPEEILQVFRPIAVQVQDRCDTGSEQVENGFLEVRPDKTLEEWH